MNTEFTPFSLDGLSPFASGATGACYQISEDKILKLYFPEFPEEKVLNEKFRARLALVCGIPTAISYDLVSVGDRRGIIFEMVQAKTLAQRILESPERIYEFGKAYAELATTLHTAKGETKDLPLATSAIRDVVPKADFLDETAKKNVLDFLDYLDTYSGFVHGDFHPNNILLPNDSPTLIDMGSFSCGCPMFDFATIYFTLFAAPEALGKDVSSFTGLSLKQHKDLWDSLIQNYFHVTSYEEAVLLNHDAALILDIVLLKSLRFDVLYGYRYSPTWCVNAKERIRNRFKYPIV